MSRNREFKVTFGYEIKAYDNGPGRRTVIGNVTDADGESQTIRGYAGELDFVSGVEYRLIGHWKKHPVYGDQFAFSSFISVKPASEDAIVSYLSKTEGITTRIAWQLFEMYDVDAIDKFIANPGETCDQIPNWKTERAMTAAKILQDNEHVRHTKIELLDLFDGRSFPRMTVNRAIREWGAAAASRIRDNPYILKRLPGIAFSGCDKLYCDLARETADGDAEKLQQLLTSMTRQGYCAAYAVGSDRSGSTWQPTGKIKAFVRSQMSKAEPEKAIDWTVVNGYAELTDDGKYIAPARWAEHERDIADHVADLLNEDEVLWPDVGLIRSMSPSDKPMTDHQVDATTTALSSRIGCIQGSPGGGKTYLVACIIKALHRMYGQDCVAIAAPTGKAGVRSTEAMLENGVHAVATTVHRLLKVVRPESGGDWQFYYDEQNPLPFRFIVVDEPSMLDTSLFASLIRACAIDTHILLTGDTDQLPPVNHGRPFLDLQSVVPVGRLTEIHRNAGRIVKACAEIRDHRKFTPSDELDEDTGENLPFFQVADDDLPLAVENLVSQLSKQTGIDPVWDVQLLTACNDKTPVSRKPLNKAVQNLLNRHGEQVDGNPFRVNDKVVNLKNEFYVSADVGAEDGDVHFIANGELGRVAEVSRSRMVVELDSPKRRVLILHAPIVKSENGIADTESKTKGAVGNWDLGYVLSVHKAQGSSCPYIVLVIDPSGSASSVQTYNWLITGLSRAEKATLCIGRRDIVNRILTRDGLKGRKTRLVELIESQVGRTLVEPAAAKTEILKQLFAPV